ncbi:MAG: phosphoenolpyruvate carboxykinase [Gemmatimonadales bacterium]
MSTPIDLSAHGVTNKQIWANLGSPSLYEHAVRRGEARLTDHGAMAVNTTPHTGRSPKDKFVVDEPSSSDHIWWDKNERFPADKFARLLADVRAHLTGQPELFVQDLFGGADRSYQLPVRFITPNAWQAMFVRNMFLRPTPADLNGFAPSWVVYHAPEFQADPKVHGTRTSTFIVLNVAERTILIGGTRYAGEMKKSIFTVLNYLLPRQGVLAMHCSANIGPAGDTAIFFGLSGTGKTTLSADPGRKLIGDDEHGWSDHGVFNFEGGCYAKVIRLSAQGEPEIWAASHRFGTVLENVVLDEGNRSVDFNADAITENTRASYPIHFIPNFEPSGQGGHPKNIVFLTADAFGVMPPIARLTPEQAMYHFLSGYTAKVAGTERGVTEPSATFSACFGAPFLPLHPGVYAKMLGEKIARHGARVWLVNTGWTGGPYGAGSRMKLSHTRAMVTAALSGVLDAAVYRRDPVFGFEVPTAVAGVPAEVLDPRGTWQDAKAYDAQAAKLAGMFRDNFKTFAAEVPATVQQAGPVG